jgi:hypothetical protein
LKLRLKVDANNKNIKDRINKKENTKERILVILLFENEINTAVKK